MTKITDRLLSKKRPAKADAAYERLVETAKSHFFAHGFRGVSMDDLAENLGMSKRTLYQHFSSKENLVKAVILLKFKNIDTELQNVLAESGRDFEGALRGLLACMQAHAGEIKPPFIRDMRRESPELFKLAESKRHEVVQTHFGKLLRSGRASGMIRKDIPVPLMIELLLGTLDAVVNPVRLTELGLSPKAAFSTITAIFLEGVVVRRKGNK